MCAYIKIGLSHAYSTSGLMIKRWLTQIGDKLADVTKRMYPRSKDRVGHSWIFDKAHKKAPACPTLHKDQPLISPLPYCYKPYSITTSFTVIDTRRDETSALDHHSSTCEANGLKKRNSSFHLALQTSKNPRLCGFLITYRALVSSLDTLLCMWRSENGQRMG